MIKYSQAKKAIQLLREFCFHRFKGDDKYFFQVDRGNHHTRIHVQLEEIVNSHEPEEHLLYLQHQAEQDLEDYIRSLGKNGYYYS